MRHEAEEEWEEGRKEPQAHEARNAWGPRQASDSAKDALPRAPSDHATSLYSTELSDYGYGRRGWRSAGPGAFCDRLLDLESFAPGARSDSVPVR